MFILHEASRHSSQELDQSSPQVFSNLNYSVKIRSQESEKTHYTIDLIRCGERMHRVARTGIQVETGYLKP